MTFEKKDEYLPKKDEWFQNLKKHIKTIFQHLS